MNIRLILSFLLILNANTTMAETPVDTNQALSELSQLFYEDQGTLGQDTLNQNKLDFSLESLKEVNKYLEQVRSNKEIESSWNRVVLRAGAYVGEVIRKNDVKANWRWLDYESAKALEPEFFESLGMSLSSAAVLYSKEKGFTFPLAKVEKFLINGSEDDVYFFATVAIREK